MASLLLGREAFLLLAIGYRVGEIPISYRDLLLAI
jgi:hypothetical protein